MLNWDDLRILLVLSRERTVRGSAAILGTSHTTITRRIEQLEKALGIQLFIRGSKYYEITAEGNAILTRSLAIEDHIYSIERIAQKAASKAQGCLTVTMPDVFATHFLAQYLDQFSKLYPSIALRLIFTDDILDLTRHNADIAIRYSNYPQASLVGKKLTATKEAVYATPAYLERTTNEENPEKAKFVSWRSAAVKRSKPFASVSTHWDISNVNVQLAVCRNSSGYVQLPCFIGDTCDDIVRVLENDMYKGRDIWMVYHKELKSTPKIKAFRDFLTKLMKSNAHLFHGVD